MDIDYKAIGKRIKFIRIRQDIKQDALAEMAELSPSHMSNIETGKTKLSLPMIIALANALNVSVDELLCDNVIRSKVVFEGEAEGIFDDCSDYETRIMVDIMKAAKDSIRHNSKLRD